MKWLDLTLPSPEANLAWDELLLAWCEAASEEVLRFWEPATHFVVLGLGCRAETEVYLDACRRDRVPVLRRISGGGTVVLGPGCLSFSLVVRPRGRPEWKSVRSTYAHVLGRHTQVFRQLLPGRVEAQGISDLTHEGRKFSGNAQRRRRDALLFHGTFLLGLDLEKIERYLPPPPRQPAYRAGRSHAEFLTNVYIDGDEIKRAIREAWGAASAVSPASLEEMSAAAQHLTGCPVVPRWGTSGHDPPALRQPPVETTSRSSSNAGDTESPRP